jgi:cobalt/nickel transport system permease protein
MHLGNGAITPACAVYSAGLAAAGLGTALLALRREGLTGTKAFNAGALGLFVFGAQMINVPVMPFSSAHLVGGVLLAALAGPGLGALTMSLVLLAQAVFLHDGALVALGANIINMALIPAAMVAWLQARKPAKSWSLGAVAAASVLAAVGVIVAEVAAFRGPGFGPLLSAFAKEMFFNHLWVSLGEGVITLGVLAAVSALNEKQIGRRPFAWHAGAALAGLILSLASPWLASSLPDGYEAALHASGLEAKVAVAQDFFHP